MSLNIVFLELASHAFAHVVPENSPMVSVQRIDGKEVLAITENGDTYYPQVWKRTDESLIAGAHPRENIFTESELDATPSAVRLEVCDR